MFNDNYGTSEEKMFAACFKTYVDELQGKYDEIYLIWKEISSYGLNQKQLQ